MKPETELTANRNIDCIQFVCQLIQINATPGRLLNVSLSCPPVDLQEEFPEHGAAVSGGQSGLRLPEDRGQTERRNLVHRWRCSH